MDTWWSGKKQSQTKPNKAKFKKAKMNVKSYIKKGYENKPPVRAPKKQSQTSKRQKPMQTFLPQRIMKKSPFSGSDKTNPNKPNFRANIMLPRITINTRRKPLAHYPDQIKAPNACDWVAEILHFILFSVVRFVDYSLVVVSGKMTPLSDILTETGLKCCQKYLAYQIVDSGGRFLLTNWAIFYSIEVLETNTYKGLLFISLVLRNRGLNRLKSGFLVLVSKFEYWRSGPAEMILCMLTDQPGYCHTPKISFLEKVQC